MTAEPGERESGPPKPPEYKRSRLPALLILSALLCAGLAVYHYLTWVPIQAEPLLRVFAAVERQDPELLEGAFSRRILKRFEKRYQTREGLSREAMWKKILPQYNAATKDELDGYRRGRLRFIFKGDARDGRVLFELDGKKLGGMRVINEDGLWKLDER